MRIAVDSLITAAVPALSDYRSDNGVKTAEFEPLLSPSKIATRLTEIRPDVVLVDRTWLELASMLKKLVQRSGSRNARIVVGAKNVDDVLKIQAVHRGMHDVVDLGRPVDDIIKALQRVNNGESSLQHDELWLRVPRPPQSADIASAPSDSIDLAILELICIGYRDDDIAQTLHYSVQAVKNRIGAMFKRANLNNRTELAWQFTNELMTARLLMDLDQSTEGKHGPSSR